MKRYVAALLIMASVALLPMAVRGQATLTPLVKESPVDTPMRVLFVGGSIMYYAGALQAHTHRMAVAATPSLDPRPGFTSVQLTIGMLRHYPLGQYPKPASLGKNAPSTTIITPPSRGST